MIFWIIKNAPQQQTVTPKKQEYLQKLKSDAAYSATVIRHSSKKGKNNDAAPADINQSAGGKPIQPRLWEYPKSSEEKSHGRSFVRAWFDKYQ